MKTNFRATSGSGISELKTMRNDTRIEKNKVHDFDEIIDHKANSIVIKMLINKPSGNIRLLTLDQGEMLLERISPFDNFIYIIDGIAEIIIDDETHQLNGDQFISINAHCRTTIKASERLKMMSTTIKSGYESVVL